MPDEHLAGLRLLNTPEWNGLTAAEKRVVGNVYGNGGTWATGYTRGGRQVIEALEAKGLVTVTWGERKATVTLREAGWSR
jgi:hypothetical protein